LGEASEKAVKSSLFLLNPGPLSQKLSLGAFWESLINNLFLCIMGFHPCFILSKKQSSARWCGWG
jgi:hypothetical protein